MRGFDPKQPVIFSYVALEDRVPKDHPLRVIRGIVDRVWRTFPATSLACMRSEVVRRCLPSNSFARF